MKKWLRIAGLGLAMTASAGVHAADKIAIVNVGSIFQQLPASDAMNKQLESEFKDRLTELQGMERDLQGQMQKLQRDSATMKGSERSKLEKEVMAKRDQFTTKAQAFEQDKRRRTLEERGKILSRIQDAVKTVAGKSGYDLVLDSNAIAFSNPAKDITSDVLKQVK